MTDTPAHTFIDHAPLAQSWDWYLMAGAAATLGSAMVVGYAVSMVHETFGGISSWLGFAFASVCVGIAFAYSASRGRTRISAPPMAAFPVVTWVWCRLALRMPGSVLCAHVLVIIWLMGRPAAW